MCQRVAVIHTAVGWVMAHTVPHEPIAALAIEWLRALRHIKAIRLEFESKSRSAPGRGRE
jgi:hypothetical protein